MSIIGGKAADREAAQQHAANRAKQEQQAKYERAKAQAEITALDASAALDAAIEWWRDRKRDYLSTQPAGETLALISIAGSLDQIAKKLK
jgi:hypothetical protein